MILLVSIPLAWFAMIVLMIGVWWLQRRLNDAGIVDVAWTYAVGTLSVLYCVFGSGDVTRRAVVGSLAAVWSLRLGTYVLVRVLRLPEDGRYVALKEQSGDQAQKKLFVFYQYQAFGAVLFSLPMMLAANNPLPWGWLDFTGIAIWFLALGGESLADRQLSQFRSDTTTRGQVCQRGLWRYSRHPNYFFEWLHWWAYVAFAWQLPWGGLYGWLSLLGPAAMYYFINHVTGIPPTEQQALRSRGDAYRQYQKTTSAFIPWPPKQETSSS